MFFLAVATACLYNLAAVLYISQDDFELLALAILNNRSFLLAECLSVFLSAIFSQTLSTGTLPQEGHPNLQER